MPATAFRDQDVKKYSYADKRAMYLGVIAQSLEASGLCRSMKAVALGNDVTKPALLLHLSESFLHGSIPSAGVSGRSSSSLRRALSSYRFRLIPVLSPAIVGGGGFPSASLTPAWNNVRTTVYARPAGGDAASAAAAASAPTTDVSGAAADATAPPTPHYNAWIAADVVAAAASAAIRAALLPSSDSHPPSASRSLAASAHYNTISSPSAVSALIALKTWIRRRGWGRTADGITGFHAAALVASLVQSQRVLRSMTPLQALRAVLTVIAEGGLSSSSQKPPAVLMVSHRGGSPSSSRGGGGRGGSGSAAAAAAYATASDKDGDDESDEEGEEEGNLDGDVDDDIDDDAGDNDDEDDAVEIDAAAAHTDGARPAAFFALSPAVIASHRSFASAVLLVQVASPHQQVARQSEDGGAPTGLVVNIMADVSGAVIAEFQREAAHALSALASATPPQGDVSSSSSSGSSSAAESTSATGASRTTTTLDSAATASTTATAAALSGGGIPFDVVFGRALPPALMYDRLVAIPMPASPVHQHLAPAGAAATAAGGLITTSSGSGSSTGESTHTAAPALSSPSIVPMFCDMPTWGSIASAMLCSVLTRGLGDRLKGPVRVMTVYAAAAAAAAPHIQTPSTSSSSEASGGDAAAAAAAAAAADVVQTWPAPEPLSWRLSAPPPHPSTLWIGLTLDPHNCTRIVERGPPPESVLAAREFTHLWGPQLCELRRFADGTIVHSVVWDAARLGGRAHARHAIVPLIIAHLAGRHLGADVPVGVLHAGDRVTVSTAASNVTGRGAHTSTALVARGGATAAAGASSYFSKRAHSAPSLLLPASTAAALYRSDIAVTSPSLALERLLDGGGCITADVSVTYAPTSTSAATEKSSGSARPTMKGTSLQASDVRIAAHTSSVVLPPPTLGDSERRHGSNGSSGDSAAAAAAAAAVIGDPLIRGPGAAFSSAMQAFDFVCGALRSAPGLPLKISTIQGTSPMLRYTAQHAPAPHPLATAASAAPSVFGAEGTEEGENATSSGSLISADALVLAATAAALTSSTASPYDAPVESSSSSSSASASASQCIAPMDVVITLESSSKWPADDIAAIWAMKVAFLLKIKYGVSAAHKG